MMFKKIKEKKTKRKIHRWIDRFSLFLMDNLVKEFIPEVIKNCPFCQCDLYYIRETIEEFIEKKVIPSHMEAVDARVKFIMKDIEERGLM